jgi:hypothetical protein
VWWWSHPTTKRQGLDSTAAAAPEAPMEIHDSSGVPYRRRIFVYFFLGFFSPRLDLGESEVAAWRRVCLTFEAM